MPLTNINGIIAKVSLSTNSSAPLGSPVPFDTVIFDTQGAFNTSTHQFRVLVPGKYRVGGNFGGETGGSATSAFQVWKNGAPIADGTLSGNYVAWVVVGEQHGNTAVFAAVAGDLLTIVPDSSINLFSGQTYAYFEKVS